MQTMFSMRSLVGAKKKSARMAVAVLLTVAAVPTTASWKRLGVPPQKRNAPSKRVLNLNPLAKWLKNPTGALLDEPVWVGPNEILAHSNIGDGYFDAPYRLNLRTGKFTTPSIEPEVFDCKPAHWKLSPDRKWILWLQGHNEYETPGLYKIYASSLKGKEGRCWVVDKQSENSKLFWVPDGHQFICFQMDRARSDIHFNHALLYDFAAPKRRPVAIALPADVIGSRLLGFLPDGSFLTADDPGMTGRTATSLTSFPLSKSRANAQRHPIRMPAGAGRYTDVRLSPDGKSLVWILCLEHKNGDSDYNIWISRADGTRMHCIGAEPGGLAGWYPNSKALLFIHDYMNDKVYAPNYVGGVVRTWDIDRVPILSKGS